MGLGGRSQQPQLTEEQIRAREEADRLRFQETQDETRQRTAAFNRSFVNRRSLVTGAVTRTNRI